MSAASASALAIYGVKFREELAAVVDLLGTVLADPSNITDEKLFKSLPSEIMPLPWLMRMASLDSTTQGHCLNVALLVGSILKQLGKPKERIERAMACALLHDVGKLKIERELLEARRALTQEEFAKVKQHSKYGYELLINCVGITRRAALVALRHHVKKPGFGYPPEIDVAELKDIDHIVQFCDIFDALVTRRPYKEVITPFKALQIVWKEFEDKVDPRAGKICLRAIQDGFIGAAVYMSDGDTGTIVDIVERKPVGYPVVKLSSGQVIECDSEQQLEVIHILGMS